MFHIYFLGSSEGLVFDVATASFDVGLWNPLRDYLRGPSGCDSTPGRAVTGGADRRDGFAVDTDCGDAASRPTRVVLATDVAGLRTIVDELARTRRRPLAPTRRRAPHRGAVRGAPAVAGPPGESPTAPRSSAPAVGRRWTTSACWSATSARRATGRAGTGGSVVELHAYAVTDDPARCASDCWPACTSSIPRPHGARIVGETVLCRNDCPRFAPGDFADRPGVDTPHDGVVLAGDGIRIDLPVALMERAATTGWSAANRLLAHFGVVGHALDTVPTQGRSAALRRLAARERQPRR